MPYISQADRKILDSKIDLLLSTLTPERPGEINYIFSKIIWELFDLNQSYKNANALLGILETVKLEFYRRKVAPYEEQKMQENGDL
jgi:hypothetical protein